MVLGLVIAAAVGMQTYVKRGLQARAKAGADLMINAGGQALSVEGGRSIPIVKVEQYEPYYASSSADTERKSAIIEKAAAGRDSNLVLTDQQISRQEREIGATQTEGELPSSN